MNPINDCMIFTRNVLWHRHRKRLLRLEDGTLVIQLL